MPVITATNVPGRIAVPTNLTPDNQANFGMFGFLANANAQAMSGLVSVAYGAATTRTLLGVELAQGTVDLSGTGTLALSMPSVSDLKSALPGTIPKDGTFNFRTRFINDGTGATITITPVTNVTILGNATLATNTVREFLVNVNVNANSGVGTVTMLNLGTWAL